MLMKLVGMQDAGAWGRWHCILCRIHSAMEGVKATNGPAVQEPCGLSVAASYATRAHKVVFLQLQKHSGLTFEFLIALPTLVVQLVVRTALSC